MRFFLSGVLWWSCVCLLARADDDKAYAYSEAAKKSIEKLVASGVVISRDAKDRHRLNFQIQHEARDTALDLITLLRDIPMVIHLNLSETRVGDTHIKQLKELESLEKLLLNHTELGDAGLLELVACTSLKQLYVYGTKVSDEGIAKFKTTRPGVVVIKGRDDILKTRIDKKLPAVNKSCPKCGNPVDAKILASIRGHSVAFCSEACRAPVCERPQKYYNHIVFDNGIRNAYDLSNNKVRASVDYVMYRGGSLIGSYSYESLQRLYQDKEMFLEKWKKFLRDERHIPDNSRCFICPQNRRVVQDITKVKIGMNRLADDFRAGFCSEKCMFDLEDSIKTFKELGKPYNLLNEYRPMVKKIMYRMPSEKVGKSDKKIKP